MFANSCESYKLYQPSNLGISYCWIYSVTPLDCSRLRDSRRLPKIEKRKLGRGRAAPTPPPFPFFPVLRSYFRVSFTYASFLLSERLEYAWITCARKMAYSACRQYSQKSLILLKILLGPPYSSRILLSIPKHFRIFMPYIFRNIKRNLGQTPKN